MELFFYGRDELKNENIELIHDDSFRVPYRRKLG